MAGMLALFLSAAALDSSLNLVCTGRSLVAAPVETTTVVATDGYGGSAYGTGVRRQIAETEQTVGFRMANGTASIRVPAVFLPAIKGGSAGWFKVKNLVVTETEITGKAAINFLTNPAFRINRTTGEMTTSGGNTFVCEPETSAGRKF